MRELGAHQLLVSNAIVYLWSLGVQRYRAQALFSDVHWHLHRLELPLRISVSLPMLLICRVLQGLEVAVATDGAGHHGGFVREKKRGQAFALYALVTVLAPSIGPTIGGWITDNYNWR